MHVYREKTLQLAATDWLRSVAGYEELAADVEATGERMDSVGLLEGSVIAIEVKPSVHAGMIYHRSNRSGSLEAKLAATVGGLYGGAENSQLSLLKNHWNPSLPLEIAILAGNYTNPGLAALKELLTQRGGAWRFNSRIWRWTGECVETLFRFEKAEPTDIWENVPIPPLIGKQQRQPALTLDHLHQLAVSGGHQETFSTFLKEAATRQYRLQLRRTGLTIRSRNCAMISLFLTDIGEAGINTGIDVSALLQGVMELPGSEAPRAGYLNTNRYIGSPAAVSSLFALLRV